MKDQENMVTHTKYMGSNQTMLQEVVKTEGYTSNKWVTYLQAKELGYKLVNAKGKGVGLVRYATDEDREKGKGYVKHFYVFNADLLEKLEVTPKSA